VPTDGAVAWAWAVLIIVFLGLAIQAVLPARNWTVWPRRSLTGWAVRVIDLSPLVLLLTLVLIIAVRLLGTDQAVDWLRVLTVGGGLALLLVVSLWWTATTRSAPGLIGRLAALVLLLLLAGSAVAVGIAVLIDDPVREHVIGAALVFAAFRPLAGFGAARWSRWDVDERAAVRLGTPRPGRKWITAEAAALLGIAGLAAIGIAIGPIAVPVVGSQHPLLLALGGLVALTMLLSLSDAVGAERRIRAT
jgi:hypothetical protein